MKLTNTRVDQGNLQSGATAGITFTVEFTLHYYDRNGYEITQEEWMRLYAQPDYTVIKKTKIVGLEISTVWLGLDHNLMGTGPPLIFETMVFGLTTEDEFQLRSSTIQEALEDHQKAYEHFFPTIVVNQKFVSVIQTDA